MRVYAGNGDGRFVLPVLALLFVSVLSGPARAAEDAPGLSFGGLVAAQGSGRFDTKFVPVFGLRFIPELTFSLSLGRGVRFDGEASADAYGSLRLASGKPSESSGDLEPYRAWVRLSTSRFEARVGLQKISFGSASLFRPLMWFDSLDPRDPLQLTDGVYGVLLRFYAKGNANVWAWGLYGNEKARGWDVARPDKRSPEFGGRVQAPLFKGELAATYHRRKAVFDPAGPAVPGIPAPPPVPEDRFALDGKWDIGVGVWFEGSLTHQDAVLQPLPWQRALTMGMDYTFGIGRGLNVTAEHFRLAAAEEAFGRGDGRSLSALMARYPVGLSGEIWSIVYYDWKSRDAYRILGWRRTTDALTFSLMLFWNPEQLLVFRDRQGSASFAGTGAQVLLAYDF